jgi:hypothetical protein
VGEHKRLLFDEPALGYNTAYFVIAIGAGVFEELNNVHRDETETGASTHHEIRRIVIERSILGADQTDGCLGVGTDVARAPLLSVAKRALRSRVCERVFIWYEKECLINE